MFLVPFLFSDPYLQLFPHCNGHHKLANRCARITDEDIYSYCSSCSLHYFHSKAALFNAGTFKVHAAKGSDEELINPTYCPGLSWWRGGDGGQRQLQHCRAQQDWFSKPILFIGNFKQVIFSLFQICRIFHHLI